MRLSLPFFCAVPDDAPARRGGIESLPMAGPYAIGSVIRGRQVVLVRNRYYHGPRPAHADAIDIRLGVPPNAAATRVLTGTADYDQPPPGSTGLPPRLISRLDARPGASRDPARQRLFVNESPGVQYIALNTARPLFADARLRRAVSFAIDRAALAAQSGPDFDPMRPTDQYLAPQIPGYRDVALYPPRGDIAHARRLAGRRHRHATLMTFDFAPYTTWAAIVRANLARIGIDVTIQALPIPEYTQRLGDPHARHDLAFFSWYVDFPDPHNVLNRLLRGSRLPADQTNNYAFFDEPAYNRRLDAAGRLSGPARNTAYARLDADLAGKASPLIAIGIPIQRDLFSARVGCQVYQPVTGIDLAELCIKHP